MTELKPCPFCGNTPFPRSYRQALTQTAYCDICDVELSITRWNRRVYPPEVQHALDRMKPKKVVCRHFNKYYGNEIGDCPNCLCTIEDESELNEHPHCKYCGQALDWSE